MFGRILNMVWFLDMVLFLADFMKFGMPLSNHQALKGQKIDPVCIYR